MKYNDIVEMHRTIANTVLTGALTDRLVKDSGTFIHGRRVDGTLIFDKPFPQIHLFPFTVTKNRVTQFDNAEILLGFWMQDKLDSTVDERQELIAIADELCNRFIDALEARVSSVTDSPVQIENVRTEPQYYNMMATASGYALRYNLISQSAIEC